MVGGGVSPLPPPFLKVDSDRTWTRMEEKTPRLHHAPRKGFLPAKNNSAPFGCPRAPPFPIKGGPRQVNLRIVFLKPGALGGFLCTGLFSLGVNE